MKKIIFLLIAIFGSFLNITYADDQKIEFSIFSRENCVHCIELKSFIEKNESSFTKVKPKYYSIDEEKNAIIFDKFTKENSISKVTPIILI
jgi:hypothetical protein